MSSQMLNVKSTDLDSPTKCGKFIVSVISRELSGMFQALFFTRAGFRVSVIESDQTVVDRLSKGKTAFQNLISDAELQNKIKSGHLTATSNLKEAVSKSDATVISVPTGIDKKKRPDYLELEKICKQTASGLRPGSLVLITSVVGLGIIQNSMIRLLEDSSGLKVGNNLGVAYCASNTWNVRETKPSTDRTALVAAQDEKSLESATVLIQTILGRSPKKTMNLKAAEAAILFNMVQTDVRLALANELAFLCEKAEVDYAEMSSLVHSENEEFSPTLWSERYRTPSSVLLADAEEVCLKLRMPMLAREINNEVVSHAVNLAKEALGSRDKTLRRAKVTLAGISQISNSKDYSRDEVNSMIKTLETKGARVRIYDPLFSLDEVPELQNYFRRNLSEAFEGTDCIMILTAHDQLKRLNLKKLKIMAKMPAAIIDLQETVDPKEAEKEGFIYRGFGRGLWKK